MPTLRERLKTASNAPAAIVEAGNNIGSVLLVIMAAVVMTAFFTAMILVKGH